MSYPFFLTLAGICFSVPPAAGTPVQIGSRLELMIDNYLVASTKGDINLLLHHPIPREIVMRYDAPWEGSGTGYQTIFRDGDIFRMYYKAWHLEPRKGKIQVPHDTIAAYAESKDGIHWTRPDLGLFEFNGSRHNNIIWMGNGSHDFTPFKDTNPACRPGEEYKAIARGENPTGVYAFKSSDGIHWSLLQETPIITKGAFDTQNLAFWDPIRKEYRAYIRDFHNGIRDIRTATSPDFHTWTEPEQLVYPGKPDIALYTNQIKPYYRAPHIFIGFPTRYIERGWSPSMETLPDPENRKLRYSASPRYGMALTDALFMSSRDGKTFHRWDEAFLRPGPRQKDSWAYGDNYIAWQLVETPSSMEDAPPELSLYATEGYWTGNASELRRYTLRMDGFVSMHASSSGGEFTTKPIIFTGKYLDINFSTSAAGSIQIEIQHADGTPVPGYTLSDAPEIFGDAIAHTVPWKDGKDLAGLSGKPVRLRFVLRDADLYAFRFHE